MVDKSNKKPLLHKKFVGTQQKPILRETYTLLTHEPYHMSLQNHLLSKHYETQKRGKRKTRHSRDSLSI